MIPEPAPTAPTKEHRPAKRTKTPPPPPPPAPGTQTAETEQQPALPQAKTIAKRPLHTINEAEAVARRRDST